MRVLHFITRMILGGAQENTLYTVLGLADKPGVTVKLITGPAIGPEGELVALGRAQGADIELMDCLRREIRPVGDLMAVSAMRRAIRTFAPEVVHTHSSKAGVLGRLAAWLEGVPAIVHTIHGLPFHPYQSFVARQAYIASERLAAQWCHRIISVADAMTDQALAAGVGRPEQFVTIHSGMETDTFLHNHADPRAVRSEFGVPEGRLLITKVARLFELKGHDDVLEAAPSLLKEVPQAHLLFVGNGLWRERLEQKARDLGVGDHVTFAGLVPAARIPDIMHASDLVVHASYREGLPRVVPQALLSGVPVVCYDVDGSREVCRDGRTGRLVRPGDKAALAQALRELSSDEKRRRELGQAGRRLCARLFPTERMVARIYDEYRRLLRPASAALPLDAGVPCPATRETAAETAPSAAGIR